MINSYEKEINELQQKIDEYVEKEEYKEKINNLNDKNLMYQNDNE